MAAWLTGTYHDDRLMVEAGGSWTLSALSELDGRRRRLLAEAPAVGGAASIDLGGVEKLDTAGAWLLDKLTRELVDRGWQVEWSGARDAHAGLLAEVRSIPAEPLPPAPAVNPLLRMIAHLRRSTLTALDEARCLLSFYGQTLVALSPSRCGPPGCA
jgi:phospholipid/cholesterol/gamma-HCH transport system permease protein